MNNDSLILHQHWDSKQFGFSVARIRLKQYNNKELIKSIEILKKQKYRLAYLSIPIEKDSIAKSAQACGGIKIDERVTFQKEINTSDTVELDSKLLILPFLNHKSTKELRELVLESGQFSRFNLDSNFSSHQYRNLYVKWLENSLNGIIASEVFICKINKKIVGFISVLVDGSDATIGLLSVHKDYRKRHIATELLHFAEQYARKSSCKRLVVVTQKRNEVACKFYQKNNFIISNVENIYHFWFIT